MGRGSIPDDHPMFMNAARSAALSGADAVLMVGGRFNWVFQFGRAPRFAEGVRIAHIDIVAEEFYSGADVETGIVADCAIAVDQLNGLSRGAACASRAATGSQRSPRALAQRGRLGGGDGLGRGAHQPLPAAARRARLPSTGTPP